MPEDIEEKKPEEQKEKIENKKPSKKQSEDLTEKLRENPWVVSTFVLGVLVIILLIGLVGDFSLTGNVVSENDIGQQLLDFYEANGAQGLILNSVEEISGVYKVNFEYQGQIVPIFATKDGKFAGSLSPLTSLDSEEQEPGVVKSDKPVVELFIMTHCPYGTQAEKGILQTLKELGDTIDSKIRFVHYFMHEPEEEETPRQLCIREEQPDKWYDYLECFLKDGDANRCLLETGIDQAALNSCIKNNADEYYAEDSALSEGYEVRGSPSLILNGQMVQSSRNSASYLQTICSAFNEAPELCETLELASTTPSPGFGWEGSGSNSGGQC